MRQPTNHTTDVEDANGVIIGHLAFSPNGRGYRAVAAETNPAYYEIVHLNFGRHFDTASEAANSLDPTQFSIPADGIEVTLKGLLNRGLKVALCEKRI